MVQWLETIKLQRIKLGVVFIFCIVNFHVHTLAGLNPRVSCFARFLGILSIESFTSSALGLTVGSFAPSTEAAAAIGPAVMVVFIVFGGYYVNAENVPSVLRWLPRTSLIKQAFEALCVNEFRGTSFEADAKGSGMRTGEAVGG